MSEGEMAGSTQRGGSSGRVLPFPAVAPPARVSFSRDELRAILNVYGRGVADGEWRDYAIDFERDRAVFSIFRRTGELPLYRIVKDPRLARKQGAFAVLTTAGLVLKRGSELPRVLRVLDAPPRLVTA